MCVLFRRWKLIRPLRQDKPKHTTTVELKRPKRLIIYEALYTTVFMSPNKDDKTGTPSSVFKQEISVTSSLRLNTRNGLQLERIIVSMHPVKNEFPRHSEAVSKLEANSCSNRARQNSTSMRQERYKFKVAFARALTLPSNSVSAVK